MGQGVLEKEPRESQQGTTNGKPQALRGVMAIAPGGSHQVVVGLVVSGVEPGGGGSSLLYDIFTWPDGICAVCEDVKSDLKVTLDSGQEVSSC